MNEQILKIGEWVIGLLLTVGGVTLIFTGIKGVIIGLKSDTQDWKKAIIGIAIALGGGLMLILTATGVMSYFKTNGQNIPH